MKSLIGISFIFLFASSVFSQKTVKYNTYLRSDVGIDTMWDGRVVRIYGIASKLSESPHLPAKTLYCNEGDTLVLHTLSISQGDHHTIHLHGMDATTPNDGDPATSFWLNHMQDTDYTVFAAHAGTYLYHCHVADVLHVQMGMYGLIVVKPKDGSNTTWTGGPAFDRSYNWLFSEVDPAWHDSIPKHDPVADTVHIPPYLPKYFLINGLSETQIPVNDSITLKATKGESIYLRTGSIGFFYERLIFPKWMHARKIDSDGRPLDNEIQNDTVEIAPGERFGILLDASVELSDKIDVEFVNMNSDSVWNTQHVPVVVGSESVKENGSANQELVVVPNPAGTSVTFSLKIIESDNSTIQIFDLMGKIVYQNTASLPAQIDIRSLPSGNYSVIINTSHKSFKAKFTVVH